jgi:hypothetical protein
MSNYYFKKTTVFTIYLIKMKYIVWDKMCTINIHIQKWGHPKMSTGKLWLIRHFFSKMATGKFLMLLKIFHELLY